MTEHNKQYKRLLYFIAFAETKASDGSESNMSVLATAVLLVVAVTDMETC